MGKLYIVSTPIGNLDDITLRAIQTLTAVNYVLCEDTRHTGQLMAHLSLQKHLIAYYDEIEQKKLPEIIELLETQDVALVSDAGTPLISDPGFRLVRECIKRNIPVVSIPGPSAVLTALTSSGLPTNEFHFYGYPPEKQSQRIKKFQSLTGTCIFYCAPHKLTKTLEDLKDVLGDIEIVIARELTKIHEEMWRGKITDAHNQFINPKGEIVILWNKRYNY